MPTQRTQGMGGDLVKVEGRDATRVNGNHAMVSADELHELDMPPIEFLWGDLLRPEGRLAIIGAPKTGKSFFAMQLGIHLATGTPFLGMDTREARVLYIDFEISKEKLKERLDDMYATLGIDPPHNLIPHSPGPLSLEKAGGREVVGELIEAAKLKLGGLDVVVIDPRRQSMGGDENQSEVMTAWTNAIDYLRTEHDVAVVVVHHTGKSTSGAGRGSSVFDAWLDTMMWLEPGVVSGKARLRIKARDTDMTQLDMEFDYPTWRLTPGQEAKDKSKVDQAAEFIVVELSGEAAGELERGALRLRTLQGKHSEYAFKQALKKLVADELIDLARDEGRQGNSKTVRLNSPPKPSTIQPFERTKR